MFSVLADSTHHAITRYSLLVRSIVVARLLKQEGKHVPRTNSPHIRFNNYIVTAWMASTVVGIELFLFEVIVVRCA